MPRAVGVPVIALAATVAALMPAADGRAATASGGKYSAEPGETNHLTVTLGYRPSTHDYAVTYADSGVTITPGPNCVAITSSEVTCEPVTRPEIALRNRDDTLTVLGTGPNTAGQCLILVYGGSGDDLLSGSSRADCLFGGRDNDRLEGHAGERLYDLAPTEQLYGGPGDDVLFGGAGPDLLVGGWGADVQRGGRGTADLVYYYGRGASVRVDLKGGGDGGAAREHDLVGRDVEDIIGGEGADVLLGNARPNLINGGPGGDLIRGYGGLDSLEGGDGPDVIAGGDGGDWIFAGYDNDGHYQPDGPRPNLLRGGAGRDILFSWGNGRDRLVDGGTGIDIAGVDLGVDPVRRVEQFAARAR